MVKAILTKPLDGMAEGAEREFSQADFDRLKKAGAVRAAPKTAEKAAPAVENKMAPTAANKSDAPPKAVVVPDEGRIRIRKTED